MPSLAEVVKRRCSYLDTASIMGGLGNEFVSPLSWIRILMTICRRGSVLMQVEICDRKKEKRKMRSDIERRDKDGELGMLPTS